MDRRINIANKLKEARMDQKLTQSELALKINETQGNISRWENGKSVPLTSQLLEICTCLNIDIDELLDNRLVHFKKKEKLVELGKNILELLKIKTPDEFYNDYQLVHKEQILVFPEAACKQLKTDIENEGKKNCLDIDNGSFYAYRWSRLVDRTRDSKAMSDIQKVLKTYIYQDYPRIEDVDTSIANEKTKFSSLYIKINEFITFWVWVNQMMVHMSSDLSENGLRLTIDPITDEEFYINKSFFPYNPGSFIYRIMISRIYHNLVARGLLDDTELQDFFEDHFNDTDVDLYFNIAHEKFNYINKIRFYSPKTRKNHNELKD